MICVDIFSGCGGLSLGFEQANFDVVAAIDNWQPALDVYKENFSHPVIQQDLSNEDEVIKKIIQFSPNLIMGGPPCQDFSNAGKRDITLGRADLTSKGYNLNSCDPKGIELTRIRPLTTIERSYIQTFPKDFKFNGTKTNLEQMIGNAVPVKLAKFVAEAIKNYQKHGSINQPTLFDTINQFEIPNKALHREYNY